MSYVAFRIGEAFPADDLLSEWLVTLAVAMNDIAFVHARLEDDQDRDDRAFYWQRLALAHFTEVGLFLSETREIEEVSAFVETLPADTRANYERCLDVFEEQRGRLFTIRNKTTFHYPELRLTAQAERPVRRSLTELADERGVIRPGSLRTGRALFGDDVIAALFARELGGLDALPEFYRRVGEGTTSFVRFTNLALDEYLARKHEEGVAIENVEPVTTFNVVMPPGGEGGAD
jgi:hypothetical protein